MENIGCQFVNFDCVQECRNFDLEQQQHFKIIRSTKTIKIVEKSIQNNYFIFVLQGSCFLSYNQSTKIELTKETFALAPQNTKIDVKIEPNSKVAILQFRPQECSCNKIYLDDYKQIARSATFEFRSLQIKPHLKILLEQLENYITENICCGRLFELKQEEFFFVLRHFYTKQEVANMLIPIVDKKNDFKDFIEANFEKVQTISQLIQLSAMCKTYFYERFKVEYGMTAKQWMLKQKVKVVERKFAEPGICIKDIVRLYNFPSSEYLHKFCRKHFEATPTEIIKRNSLGNRLITTKFDDLEKRV